MKFKKGDRVIVNDNKSADIIGIELVGNVGTVLEYHSSECVGDHLLGVEFDEHMLGHDCNGQCKWGYGWWVLESQCELIDATPLEERDGRVNYYTGKVVCVEDGMNLVHVGRMFNFVDGDAKYKGVSVTKEPVTSVDDLNSRFTHIKFIEVIE